MSLINEYKQTRIYILNMLPISYMILNKLLNISELNSLFGRWEIIISSSVVFVKINKTTFENAQCSILYIVGIHRPIRRKSYQQSCSFMN